MSLQIEDPLVEKLYAVLIGKRAGNALGAVGRLQVILSQYYGFDGEVIPDRLSIEPTPNSEAAGVGSCSPE
jgi:hypothetical protein